MVSTLLRATALAAGDQSCDNVVILNRELLWVHVQRTGQVNRKLTSFIAESIAVSTLSTVAASFRSLLNCSASRDQACPGKVVLLRESCANNKLLLICSLLVLIKTGRLSLK